MSKQNRKNEYDRLVGLGRHGDIPKDLMDEFYEKPVQAVSHPVKKKQVK